MIRQYLQVKAEAPDAILFFRLGDFYEMFYADAEIASRELELTLTSRNKGSPDSVPLCGVPYHAASTYISKLISKGYKVAICDQVEDPKLAKGIVRREITRIVTPGLVLDSENLEADANNFLLGCLPPSAAEGDTYGLAYVDISTGEFRIAETQDFAAFEDELLRVAPREVCLPENLVRDRALLQMYAGRRAPMWNGRPPSHFDFDGACRLLEARFGQERLAALVAAGYRNALAAAGALLLYLEETQKCFPKHLHGISAYEIRDYMILDEATKRNLEITHTWMERSKQNSLLGVLDLTLTSMGARRLRRWVLYPLLQREPIEQRLDAVEELKDKDLERAAIRSGLQSIQDLERLNSKISLGVASPRDLMGLKHSLLGVPALRERMAGFRARKTQDLMELMDPLEDVVGLLESALAEDPPVVIREGGIFREGYREELDELRGISRDGKRWIASLEAKERERTGIGSLKVRFNRVFGYYIEVTRANLGAVPADYERRQTLANAERFTTPVLREYEQKVLGAQERVEALEYELYLELREQVAGHSLRIRTTAEALSELDCLAGLAEAASRFGYVRPEISPADEIVIWEGRHPVIEQMRLEERFVPNDVLLDGKSNRMLILTGPNMAGKSTYMRQIALIVLMAQVGSFVPAQSARVGLVDRIFTRVGAMDNLVRGQSTFMVEMKETAHILEKATARSLILLDEIGRGTSTFDGMSIAWAVAEHIERNVQARTLFATHYHELAALADRFPSVRNFHIAVKEWGDNVLFLRKVKEGSTSHSYGIQVARLAGIPEGVVRRAQEIVRNLELGRPTSRPGQPGEPGAAASAGVGVGRAPAAILASASAAAAPAPAGAAAGAGRKAGRSDGGSDEQPLLFPPEAGSVEKDVLALEISRMTPLEALNKLQELQEKLRDRTAEKEALS
ncbi:MAG: DNA mismatch repair protein MutS [bacterium]